ncbi:MAG TPA: protein kinase [Pyrinomonadaceae bacterium]|nr:protein kinase [Pyrinomonadaceae bacterium]
MSLRREEQITSIVQSALERDPAERAAFVSEACAGDEGLRRAVEARLEGQGHGKEEEVVRDASDAAGLLRPMQSTAYELRLIAPRPDAGEGAAHEESLPEGTTLGPYRVLEKLGQGGMGAVYLAKDVRLGRRVALKFLPAHFAQDEERVRRFVQEARAASALNHPNIITVHEIGEVEGRHFIATEFVEGRTLRELIEAGPPPVEAALEICAQIAGALSKAHQGGVIHRDIKPENVMVDADGHVKVLDFGIAKQFAPPPRVDADTTGGRRVSTEPGLVLGTSSYMSPEQVRGLPLDARTDVWSLGCVLHEMLNGSVPFDAPTYGDLVVSILQEEPPPLVARASVPAEVLEELERIVRRALAKRREDRYPSAREMQQDMRRLHRRLEFAGVGAGRDVWTEEAEARNDAPPSAPPQQRTTVLTATPQPTASEQRKQITVLFAELAGFEELAEGADAEEVREVLDALWRRVDACVADYGGTVERHSGETIIALWGATEAHEDDPERTVHAALAMQEAAREFSTAELKLLTEGFAATQEHASPFDTAAPPSSSKSDDASSASSSTPSDAQSPTPSSTTDGPSWPMRVGISTGFVLLGTVGTTGEFTATGEAVNLASRIQRSAHDGGVFVSHETYRHVRGVFDVQAPEALKMKGRAQPVEVYRVLRAKPRAFRVRTRGVEGVETRMIGRKGELRRLTDALETVFEDGELHAVTVVGDAGLGKSRLLYEFSNRVELLPDTWYIFNGRAGEAMQGLPYSLVRDLFSFRFEIQDSDPPQVAREKLEHGIFALSGGAGGEEEATMRAHFIGQLIGFDFSESRHLSGILGDVRQIHDRAFRYAAQFFAEVARRHPLILFLDDIHWADDGSLDFIDYLARHCADAPVFALCLARPTLLERRPAWGEGVERHTRVVLQPLSKKESRQLVEEILRQAQSVPPSLRELVVTGAEGNPFYVEELIKMLIDQKVIVPGAEVWGVDTSRLGEVKVPPTLTGVLQARLDNLTTGEKTVLQRASVVGRIFWDHAVEHLGSGPTSASERETVVRRGLPASEGEAGIGDVLESLRRKELIYRRESSVYAGAGEYTFKHALLRDVTYESVLRKDRRVYHRRAADWLARAGGARVGEYAGVIAEHYERAQVFDAAAEWYGRAGRQARETYAPETAIKYYRKAIAFLTAEPKRDATAAHASPQTAEQAPAQTIAAAAAQSGSASGGGARLSESAKRLRLLEWSQGLGEVLRIQSRYAEALAAYGEMRAAAEAVGDLVAQARAWNETALVEAGQGDNRAMLESTERAAALAREAGAQGHARTELARALNLQSQASTRLGDARAGMMLGDQALALAGDIREEGSGERADSLKSLGMAYHQLGRFEQAEHCKEQALALYRESGNRRGVGNMLNSLGETARLRGDYGKALARYREALAIARETGNRNGEMLYLGNLGAARAGLGDYAAAEADLRQSIALAESVGYYGISENYRFLAEALLGQENLKESLEAAEHALELGRRTENQEHIGEAWRVLGLIASRTSAPVLVGGEPHDASACFAESLRLFRHIGLEAERARALRDWSRHESRHGDAARGQAMWQESLDIFQRLGMTPEAERMTKEAE